MNLHVDICGSRDIIHVRAKNRANKFRRVLDFVGHAYVNLMENISLKAPRDFSASFWSYNFSILLCERPKPNIFMISGVLDP